MTTGSEAGRTAAGGADINPTEAGTAGGGAPEPASGSAMPPSDDPDAIRADIDRTRDELGDSVQALAAKADVKARAQQKLAAAKERARHAAQDASVRAKSTAQQTGDTVRQRPGPAAGIFAAVAAAVGAVLLARRRRAAKTQTAKRRRAR
jgi:ElaB/YqjD/DUF883 family membrane-anchored ribosome-binding protein